MASRELDYFMMPDECARIIGDAVRRYDLHAILHRRRPHRFEELSLANTAVMSDGTLADEVFFGTMKLAPTLFDEQHLGTGKFGLVLCELPFISGGHLLMGRISTKSEWYDRDAGTRGDNKDALVLFRRLAPRFRKYLIYPVWVLHTISGEVWPDRRYGYSSGALDWVASGGRLGQRGVQNLRFAPSHELLY
jgi:hypothetical protein